jgi:hypothetical protein
MCHQIADVKPQVATASKMHPKVHFASQEEKLEEEIGRGHQLEEMIIEAQNEDKLIDIYADFKAWEKEPDLEWKKEVDEDRAQDILREDAANKK